MASMTDYLEEKAIQESATFTSVEETEEQLAHAVLESYIAMTAAFANVECMLEHATIAAFCKEAEIETPDIVQESAWDAIANVFSEIGEWFKGLLRGFIGLFTSAKLQKLIAKLKQVSGSAEIKMDTDVAMMAFFTDSMFTYLENFKKEVIDSPDDVNKKDLQTKVDSLEDLMDPENWKAGALKNTINSLAGATLLKSSETMTPDNKESITVTNLIEILEKINKFDIPKRGNDLLRSLKFDKTKYIEKDTDGNEKEGEPVDKDLVLLIKKYSRLLAKAYDKITAGLIKVTDKAYKDVEIEDKEQEKKDLAEAKEAKKSVKYNADDSSENRPTKSDAYFA